MRGTVDAPSGARKRIARPGDGIEAAPHANGVAAKKAKRTTATGAQHDSASREDAQSRKRQLSAQEFMLSAFLTGHSSSPTREGKQKEKETSTPTRLVRDGTLWTDKYQPYTQDELAVHKNKVEEVRTWLKTALEGKRTHRILLCVGPPGCGKTALIKMLALELDYDIQEWTNGVATAPSAGSFRESISSRFTNFLLDADRYPALQFGAAARTTSPRRIILVEDWPNISESTTRSVVQNAIADFVHSPSTSPPLILIFSESAVRSEVDLDGSRSSANASSSDVRTIITPSLMTHYAFHRVSFNPIATTFMRKALLNIVSQEYRSVPARLRPDPELVDLIASSSNGDIRSALNNLQFVAIKESASADARLASIPKRGKKVKDPPRKEVTQLLQSISARENSLVLFHALGKVLYNKRMGDPDDDIGESEASGMIDVSDLPSHLEHFARRPSKVDVEDLFVSLSMDISTFILYLQSNYPNFVDTLDELQSISETLSQAESLGGRFGFQFQTYQFAIAVRAILLALPSPVPRRGQKMVKSDWFEMTRKEREEMELAKEVQYALADEATSMVDTISATESTLFTEVIPLLGRLAATTTRSSISTSNGLDPAEPALGDLLTSSVRSKLAQITTFQSGFGSGQSQVLGEKELTNEGEAEGESESAAIPAESTEKLHIVDESEAPGDGQRDVFNIRKAAGVKMTVLYDVDDDIED